MRYTRKIGILFGVVCLSAQLGAQVAKVKVNPQDKGQFPYKEAANPEAVIDPFVGPGSAPKQGEGGIPLGVKDPDFPSIELLGRPTDTSVMVNARPAKDVEVYYEYGTKSGQYTGKTAPSKHVANEPFNVLIDKLKPNTEYYYRMMFRIDGAGDYKPRAEHTFYTQRAPGSTFTFVAQFDAHLGADNNMEAYRSTLRKMLADKPDLMFDLGDNFQVDRLRPPTMAGVEDRVQLLRSYYDYINHSVPLMMALGNHEGEWAKNLNGTPDNVAVWDTVQRKRYIPNPEPNSFYTGASKPEPIVGLRQSYYAFDWGDATFIVLDPYWYKPQGQEMAADWWTTLGKDQYEWFKNTLRNSKATYKFVFSHNLIGGLDMRGLMRGGIETIKYTEMGGYNYDGTWGWDKARPGWEMPLHPLMVENNATIWFHGHDHLYAKQDLDGVVYQEGPMPAREGKYDASKSAKQDNYLHGTVLGGSGYIRVRVSPTDVKVDYVQTYLPKEEDATHKDGMVADTYTIKAKPNARMAKK